VVWSPLFLPDQQIQLGYKLTSEEFGAADLLRQARAAEEHGFSFVLISDHYHPWTSRQGQSPFVWALRREGLDCIPFHRARHYFSEAFVLVLK
jgi:alkanesulfonate monooxygenase SsuD/methylene tetrahydromethanopterin reductase-like flavin-dependent oxidoreductase (luciferase family)